MEPLPAHILLPPRVDGRSYTLFGDENSTLAYYAAVDELLDKLLAEVGDTEALYVALRAAIKGSRRGHFGARAKGETTGVLNAIQHHRIHDTLSRFTHAAEAHLSGLSWWKRRDRVLGMTREQYHYAMLEIALINRMKRKCFAAADFRIALLPHCLRDLKKTCKAESDGNDLLCRKCSKDCFIRHISELLEEHDIVPYIWMSLGRRSLFRLLRRETRNPGVLGIACVPEVLQGMHLCMHNDVAVVGLPLNANRCRRWMGDIHPNSFSLEQLEKLLA